MSAVTQSGLHRDTKGSKLVRYSLIGISLLFVFLMLILPLITVITEAFKQGFAVYSKAVADDYTIKAILLLCGRHQYGIRAVCRLEPYEVQVQGEKDSRDAY